MYFVYDSYNNYNGCCAVCDVTGARWHFHANSNSFHGVVPPKPIGSRWLSMWSLDECLQVCSGDLRCFAADFDMETRICYLHHRPDFADTRGPYPQVHQFVVAQRCRPGVPNQCHTFDSYREFRRRRKHCSNWQAADC